MAGLRIPFQFFGEKVITPCFWAISPPFFHLLHFYKGVTGGDRGHRWPTAGPKNIFGDIGL